MTQESENNTAQTGENERTLTDNFGVVVTQKGDNAFTIDASALNNGVDITLITSGGVLQFKAVSAVVLQAPATEQTNEPGLTLSSPTVKAFNPANAMVAVGIVQLNKISQYLTDLPDEAKAEYIVSPKSTATLFGRGLGTFNEDTASIRNIDESHGLHFNGQALTGMQIFDRPSNAQDIPYEKAWAEEIRTAWEQANATHADVVTTLAIMPKELIKGRKIGSNDVTIANNMCSRVGDINAALERQGGEAIMTQSGSGDDLWQFSATENWDLHDLVSSVFLMYGSGDGWSRKAVDYSSSRASALRVIAPTLAR